MRLLDKAQIAAGVVPVDLATAGGTGGWISMEDYRHATVIFFKDGGSVGEDPTLSIEQATDASGTGTKALNVIDEIFVKQDTSILTVGQWTKTTQTADEDYTDATSAEDEAIWVVEFDAEDLDVENGFKFFQANVSDVGDGAQLGCVLYVLTEPRYATAPEDAPSVLA